VAYFPTGEWPTFRAARPRLLAEIRAAGFEGSYTQLKAFVRQVRPTPPAAPVIRFETPAGRQAQVDFARFSFPWGVRYALCEPIRKTYVQIPELIAPSASSRQS
jgi:transposase